MKTKELIRRLQEADPSGEEECCVGNADIFFVENQEAYWDGYLQVLERDPAKAPFYDVVGARYVSKGRKINIRPLSISDAIFTNEDLPIDFSECSISNKKYYEKSVSEKREQIRNIKHGVERDFFVEYIVNRLADSWSEDFAEEDVKVAAIKFYDDGNISYADEMPKDIKSEAHKSWNERRQMQWDREVSIDFDPDGKLILMKALNES